MSWPAYPATTAYVRKGEDSPQLAALRRRLERLEAESRVMARASR